MPYTEDKKVAYEVVEKWKKECLLNDRSLIWDGEAVWTEENIRRFRTIFIENPDASGNSFHEKLQKQLENEADDVYKFVIELMYIYYIFPSNSSTSYNKKINNLEEIASWKKINFERSLPVFKGLEPGLGSTGTFFNTSRYYEVSFLFSFVEFLKSKHVERRTEILNDPWELKVVVDNIRKKIGKRVQMQHILLHLLQPEYFERMASWGHKEQIVKTFSKYIKDDNESDIDKKILTIRESLQEEHKGEVISFYHTPSISEKWRSSSTEKKKDKDKKNEKKELKVKGVSPEKKDNIPTVNFDVAPFEGGLVFENLEILIDQVTTALKKGKHIIFTGPPGTGKSKLASKICEMYNVNSTMVTASSNWSTYETIGGYRPDREGRLNFEPGIFLKCVKNKETGLPNNHWVIIDEINRADIDKAFGSLFSVLTGDEVTLPFEARNEKAIVIRPQGDKASVEPSDHMYVVPNDWRIIATMNTTDKASLYEMSYAFMRRFAFIPVGIPKTITTDTVEQYLQIWNIDTYPNPEALAVLWKLINRYRKIGPAIIEDIAKHTQDNDDFMSAITLYVLPQFEGLPIHRIKEFIAQVADEMDVITSRDYMDDFVNDFFASGDWE